MMMKQFEVTLIRLCQIDSDCVMGFRIFFSDLFSYLFISFGNHIACFELNLSIWEAGDTNI